MEASNPKHDEFLRILDSRFAERMPWRIVRVASRGLGWVSKHLPRRKIVRSIAERFTAPWSAWVIRSVRPVFDVVTPTNERYWARLSEHWLSKGLTAGGQRWSPFIRAVYAWLGVEGAAMRYGHNWQITSLDAQCCVERLYHRDKTGANRPGCPFGLRAANDGFACRTIMIGARKLFDTIDHAQMKIDISIPETLAIEQQVVSYLRDHPGADPKNIWEALKPAILDIFHTSQPTEDDFIVAEQLRPETECVIRELITTMVDGGKPSIFCQFRIVPRAV